MANTIEPFMCGGDAAFLSNYFDHLLFRPRKRLRSVVISMSVCLSVFLSDREHISGATHMIFTDFSVHVTYGHGSVLFRQGDETQGEGAVLGIFFPTNNAL